MTGAEFHAISVGWGDRLITGLLDPIVARTPYRFTHLVTAAELESLGHRADVVAVREPGSELPEADRALLASLERPDIPTIHNMIMGDRVLNAQPYDETLRYATYLANRFIDIFERAQPSAIIGGFDGLHSGIGLAVARRLGIPWFVMFFNTIPPGLCGFCTGMTPDTTIQLEPPRPDELRLIAERALDEFVSRSMVVPAYLSANSLSMILRRLPVHTRLVATGIRRLATRRLDPWTEYSVPRMVAQYARKRMNFFRLPRRWFYNTPPSTPYAFFGFHMQPESTVDVWAPFYADQFGFVEALARSMPPTHELLVKLHKSDADNYSREQLDRLRRLPGVRIVSPFASSRQFIDHADLVFAIQGTMALEAGLLGKPVLMFGDSPMTLLPSASKVNAIPELPGEIQRALANPAPSREDILRAYVTYLTPYVPGCYPDWQIMQTPSEIDDLVEMFEKLRRYVSGPDAAAPSVEADAADTRRSFTHADD